jgi:hypothetical protein
LRTKKPPLLPAADDFNQLFSYGFFGFTQLFLGFPCYFFSLPCQ